MAFRRYNEEGSDIYDDANTLERVLMTKVKELAIEQPNLVSLKKTISAVGKVYSSLAFFSRDALIFAFAGKTCIHAA